MVFAVTLPVSSTLRLPLTITVALICDLVGPKLPAQAGPMTSQHSIPIHATRIAMPPQDPANRILRQAVTPSSSTERRSSWKQLRHTSARAGQASQHGRTFQRCAVPVAQVRGGNVGAL